MKLQIRKLLGDLSAFFKKLNETKCQLCIILICRSLALSKERLCHCSILKGTF